MAICACETISSNIKPSEERPNEIEFYPNPFQNNVYIKGIENEKFDIKVYTIMGQCIWSQNKMTQNSITTTSWPVGLYIIHVTNKEYQQTFKLLKQ
jgi:hypothetical protein